MYIQPSNEEILEKWVKAASEESFRGDAGKLRTFELLLISVRANPLLAISEAPTALAQLIGVEEVVVKGLIAEVAPLAIKRLKDHIPEPGDNTKRRCLAKVIQESAKEQRVLMGLLAEEDLTFDEISEVLQIDQFELRFQIGITCLQWISKIETPKNTQPEVD